MQEDDLACAEVALRDAQRAGDVVGDHPAGVADDVRLAVPQAEHLEDVHARVHAGDDRQPASRLRPAGARRRRPPRTWRCCATARRRSGASLRTAHERASCRCRAYVTGERHERHARHNDRRQGASRRLSSWGHATRTRSRCDHRARHHLRRSSTTARRWRGASSATARWRRPDRSATSTSTRCTGSRR